MSAVDMTLVEVPVTIGFDATQHVGWLRIKRGVIVQGMVLAPSHVASGADAGKLLEVSVVPRTLLPRL